MPSSKLHTAATQGSVEAVHARIASGDSVNALDLGGSTPLHWAARKGHREVCKILLKHGADITTKNKRSETSLDVAEYMGHDDVIKLLRNAQQRTRQHVLKHEALAGRDRVNDIMAQVRADIEYRLQLQEWEREERARKIREKKKRRVQDWHTSYKKETDPGAYRAPPPPRSYEQSIRGTRLRARDGYAADGYGHSRHVGRTQPARPGFASQKPRFYSENKDRRPMQKDFAYI